MNKVFPEQGNIDLIFGRPYQMLDDWTKELAEVCYVISMSFKSVLPSSSLL